MAKICALPEELLAHTLTFLVDLPAHHKKTVSHVCKRWRGAALRASRFWATINVHDLHDLAVLAVLLERSGTAALHVYIQAAMNYDDVDNANDKLDSIQWIDDLIGQQLSLLIGHASRLRSLELYLGILEPFGDGFLRGGLHLPVLESLIIDQPSWVNENQAPFVFVDLVAPALRTQVHPDHGWNHLLQRCPLLERLSIKDCHIPSHDPLPFFIPSITVTTLNIIEVPGDPIFEHIMHGVGRVVLFEIAVRRNVRLRDGKGSERCIAIEGDFSESLHLVDLWIHLCRCHGAATAVTSFMLTSENWAQYADVFSVMSPAADVELRLTRGLWDWRESRLPPVFVIGEDGQDKGKGWDLRCDGARRACFDVAGANPCDLVSLKAVLMRIKTTYTVELCLCIAAGLSDWEQWIDKATRVLGDLNDAYHNEWNLCAACRNGTHSLKDESGVLRRGVLLLIGR